MSKNSSKTAIATMLLAVLLVAAWFLLRPSRSAGTAGPGAPATSRANLPVPQDPGGSAVATEEGAIKEVIEGLGDPWEQIEKAKYDYLGYAVYPPWSRPYDGSVENVLTWNTPSKIGQAFALTKDEQPISADVSLDQWFAGPGESLRVTVKVWQGDHAAGEGPSVPFTVRGTISTSSNVPQTLGGDDSVAELSFSRRSGDSDLEQSASFTPSKIPALATVQHDASVWLWVKAGDREFPFQLVFRYASEQTTPVVILGYAGDRIENGSLVVELNADVRTDAQFLVRGGLYNKKDGAPLAVFDGWHVPTQKGKQRLKLVFFGKILREAGVDGPYEVRKVNGVAHHNDGQLILDIGWTSKDVFNTGTYKATDFSDDEWADAEKDDKVHLYDMHIDALKKAGGPGAGP